MLEVRHQQIADACRGPWTGHAVDGHDHSQRYQHRHHDAGDLLHAVLDAQHDDDQGEERKDQETDLRTGRRRDERAEEAVRSRFRTAAFQIFEQVLDDPAADDAVIRQDEHGDDRVHPAAGLRQAGLAIGLERTHRTLARQTAQRRFGDHHGVPEGEGQDKIGQKEHAAAVFCGQIRKTPDVSQTDGRACCRQNITQFAGETGA